MTRDTYTALAAVLAAELHVAASQINPATKTAPTRQEVGAAKKAQPRRSDAPMIDLPKAELTALMRDTFPIVMRLPECGNVYIASGTPTVAVVLAEDLKLRLADVGYVDDLISALEVARTRLVLWNEDHHPGRPGGAAA